MSGRNAPRREHDGTGTDPLRPMPMTPEQVNDLVERVRVNEADVAQRAHVSSVAAKRAGADLGNLRASFVIARAIALGGAAQDTPPGRCKYCGGTWMYWAGSILDGHARCFVSREFQLEAIEFWRARPRMTMKTVADALGITESIVIGWRHYARRANARRITKPLVIGWRNYERRANARR